MLKRTIIAAILAITMPAQASAQSWLCIADMSTGFSYNKTLNKWEHTRFNVDDERLIIKPSTGTSRAYEVFEFGNTSNIAAATCGSAPNEYGFLFCDGLFGEFKFNSKNLRYVRTYIAGYVEILPDNLFSKEGNDTPNIEIGKCSPI